MIGRIANIELRTTSTAVYRVPSGQQVAIHSVHICNTSSDQRRIRMHHCTAGESASILNAMLYDVVVSGRSSIVHDFRFIMVPGDDLRMQADGTGVAAIVHGMVQ